MSRLQDIETKLSNLLSTIDGGTHGLYTYHSTTGTIQVYDEVLSMGRNSDNKHVNHVIEQQEDIGVENNEFQAGQNAFTNRAIYTITSKVYNIGNEGNAKNAIRLKLNELIDDLIYLFGNNYTLNGVVSYIRFNNAIREYEDITNNRIQSASLVTTWEVVYTQSIANPGIKACA